MSSDFWIEKRWPFDPPGYVFLGRAVDRVGAALFPRDWDGSEFTVDIAQIVPEDMSLAVAATRDYVIRRLQNAFPEWKPKTRIISPPSLLSGRPAQIIKELSADDWREAVQLLREETGFLQHRCARQRAAARAIAENCAAGNLTSAVRPLQGGAIAPLAADAWQTEVWPQRFENCQMQAHFPFTWGAGGVGAQGVGYSYIFIGTDSLTAFEKAQFDARNAATPGSRPRLASEGSVREFLRTLHQQEIHLTQKDAEGELEKQFGPGSVSRDRARAIYKEVYGAKPAGRPRSKRVTPD